MQKAIGFAYDDLGKSILLRWFLVVLLFFINPIVSLFCLSLILYQEKSRESLYILFYLLLSVYLGLINSTKVPESDLLNYLIYFEYADNLKYVDYIDRFDKEIFFYTLTFILNKVTFSNEVLYITVITTLIYFPIFISVHKFWKEVDGRKYIIIFSILLIASFHSLFGYSSHLIRQMMAGSFFIYFMTNKALYQKNNWWVMISAVFIHTSSIILFIIAFLPGLNKKISLKNISIVGLIVFVITTFWYDILTLLNSAVGGFDILNYGIQRALNMTAYTDNRAFINAEGSGIFRRGLTLLLLIVSLAQYFRKEINFRSHYIINFTIYFTLFLEVIFSMGYLFLHVRFIGYLFLLIPFSLPYLVKSSKKNQSKDFLKTAIIGFEILLIVNLYSYISRTHWQYADIYELILYPTIYYFL